MNIENPAALPELSAPDSLRQQARRRAIGARRPAAALALVLADAAGFALAALATGALADAAGAGIPPWRLAFLASLLAVALRAAAGLYPGQMLHAAELFRRGVLANGLAGLATPAFALALAQPGGGPTALAAAAWTGIACLLQPLLRGSAKRLLRQLGAWSTPATIIAPPERRAALSGYLRDHWHYGLAPLPDGETGAQVAVLAQEQLPSPAELRRLRRSHRRVILLADLPAQRASGLQPRAIGGAIGICLADPGPGRLYPLAKRLLDLAIAIPAALMLAPIIALAALLIFCVDPGPVLYRQLREGRDGRTINLLKLRTMYCDAEAALQRLLERDPVARQEWLEHYKLKSDPRILPGIGRFLRVSSLDEMPQLLHVIRGEMSLVGPRPFPHYHLDAMSEEFRRKRRSVTPGLTGLWQISSRSEAGIEQQQQLDGFYIDNRGLWLDLTILLQTLPAVLLHKGAY